MSRQICVNVMTRPVHSSWARGPSLCAQVRSPMPSPCTAVCARVTRDPGGVRLMRLVLARCRAPRTRLRGSASMPAVGTTVTARVPGRAALQSVEISMRGVLATGSSACREASPRMRLTKSTSHAIRILIDCARAGRSADQGRGAVRAAGDHPAERLQDRQPPGQGRADRGDARPQRRRAAGAPGGGRSASATWCARPRLRAWPSRRTAPRACASAATASTGCSTMRLRRSSTCSTGTPSPIWPAARRRRGAGAAPQGRRAARARADPGGRARRSLHDGG